MCEICDRVREIGLQDLADSAVRTYAMQISRAADRQGSGDHRHLLLMTKTGRKQFSEQEGEFILAIVVETIRQLAFDGCEVCGTDAGLIGSGGTYG